VNLLKKQVGHRPVDMDKLTISVHYCPNRNDENGQRKTPSSRRENGVYKERGGRYTQRTLFAIKINL
jgi:hypothetical protein